MIRNQSKQLFFLDELYEKNDVHLLSLKKGQQISVIEEDLFLEDK